MTTADHSAADEPTPDHGPLDAAALAQLFTAARSYPGWLDRPVAPALLEQLAGLVMLGPTATNQEPFRVVFVQSPDAKARLVDCVSPGNRAKTAAAPVTAILCTDPGFWRHLPELRPGPDISARFRDNPALAEEGARFNGTLQAGYFILAARALGLDCGPMGGFDAARVTDAFLQDTGWLPLLLVNLGHGDPGSLAPRAPRLDFARMARRV